MQLIIWASPFIFLSVVVALERAILSLLNIEQSSDFSFYSTSAHAWQFGIGAIAFYYHSTVPRNQDKSQFPSILSLVFLISLLLFPLKLNEGFAVVATSALTFFLLIGKPKETIRNIFWKILRWLGDRSYPIYLIHMPVVWAVIYSNIFVTNSKSLQVLYLGTSAILTLLLGHLLYSTVEIPYRRMFSEERIQRRLLKKIC